MMTLQTPPHTTDGETPDFHRTCWRTLSAATAAGCPPLAYLPTGQAVPAGHSLVECPVCSDRWVLAEGSPWLTSLRRAMLRLVIGTPGAS